MDTIKLLSYVAVPATIIAVTAIHAVVLMIATQLMVHVRVAYGCAYRIVAAEYLAAGGLLGLLLATGMTQRATAYVMAIVSLVAVGAYCIGRWLAFEGGERVGVGNGVLIQFVQIPLVLPFAIVISFLF